MASPQVCGIAACFANTKERVTNADILGYIQKTSIEGDMTFDVNGGTFTDSSCQKGSPNKYVRAVSTRETLGFLPETKSSRPSIGLGFPRQSIFMAPLSVAASQSYTFNVTAPSSSNYNVTGTDKNGSVSGNDPTITVNVGDTIEFNVSVSGHPFWVKTNPTTGTGNTVSGVVNNGYSSSTITWDTTGETAGTYYYICEYHGNMVGSIVLEAA